MNFQSSAHVYIFLKIKTDVILFSPTPRLPTITNAQGQVKPDPARLDRGSPDFDRVLAVGEVAGDETTTYVLRVITRIVLG